MKRPEAAEASAAPNPFATSLTITFDRWLQPYVLTLLRIMTGLLFLEHGMAKVFGFPPHGHIPVFPELEWFAGRVELIGGTLIALGLFTRAAAFLTSGEMAIGYFLDHAPRSFFPLLNGGDSPILYCFVFLYFVAAGAGPWSVDGLVWGRREL
jgi:putative oxidoreductase